MGARPWGTSHFPSAALTRGTNGCLNSLQTTNTDYLVSVWEVCSFTGCTASHQQVRMVDNVQPVNTILEPGICVVADCLIQHVKRLANYIVVIFALHW